MTWRRGMLLAVAVVAMILGGMAIRYRRWLPLAGPALAGPDVTVTYGPEGYRHAGLWLPPGDGPHPVVLMIHGGCWRSTAHAATMMNALAADLRRRGIATWNIEYRGVGQPGGGWPGTFEDVLAGADALRRIAPRHRLDIGRAVVAGHSAGGQLALWLGSRRRFAAIVTLSAPTDLEAGRVDMARVCGPDVLPRLVGRPTAARPDVFADTSPIRLPRSRVPTTLVTGGDDTLVPPHWAADYVRRRGSRTRAIVAPGGRHAEELLPAGTSWQAAVGAIEAAVRH